ncbi:hypothetical protein EIP91_000604 [Steccherinum ochraceum]|uniref:AB hydrolase-1 domain-containing protein n=1 Tax=Steccherinum ochraceum TaxID=92696 RepID=A0A4R0RIV9_9APHY|nr:hypothetical protein EIP91_000604 [Steccherinum ochraceum]
MSDEPTSTDSKDDVASLIYILFINNNGSTWWYIEKLSPTLMLDDVISLVTGAQRPHPHLFLCKPQSQCKIALETAGPTSRKLQAARKQEAPLTSSDVLEHFGGVVRMEDSELQTTVHSYLSNNNFRDPQGRHNTSMAHLIIECVGSTQLCLDDYIHPRQSTVLALFQQAFKEHFVLVKGTPASGKTTLRDLLYNRILQSDPSADIYYVNSWQNTENAPWPFWKPDPWGSTERRRKSGGHKATPQNPSRSVFVKECTRPTWFLFDDAHDTYRDSQLWDDVFDTSKALNANVYIVLFATYGGPRTAADSEAPIDAIPHQIPAARIMSLHPTSDVTHALSFGEDEAQELIKRIQPCEIAEDLSFWVYNSSRGHVGAMRALITFINEWKQENTGLIAGDNALTLEMFQDAFAATIGEKLDNRSLPFSRGLPRLATLPSDAPSPFSNPDKRDIFRQLARGEHISLAKPRGNASHSQRAKAAASILQNGWAHSPDTSSRNSYMAAPSFLHQLFYAWALRKDSILTRTRIANTKLLKKSGVPEALYQHEFYRVAWELLDPSFLHVSSEHPTSFEPGSDKGRIDFFFPEKRWGIEILRDGKELQSHLNRFKPDGRYRDLDMKEYVILDFRQTTPKNKRLPATEAQRLFYIVFTADFGTYSILNAQRKQEVPPTALNSGSYVCHMFPRSKVFGLGFSLGANIIAKYVGEEGTQCPLHGVVVLANPWDFKRGSEHIEKASFANRNGYRYVMGGALQTLYNLHRKVFLSSAPGSFSIIHNDLQSALKHKKVSLKQFDELVTAPIFGYRTATHYYTEISSSKGNVTIPLLALNARDDPMVADLTLPVAQVKNNPHIVLAVTAGGEHMGWFEQRPDGTTGRWYPKPVFSALLESDLPARPKLELVASDDDWIRQAPARSERHRIQRV